MFSTQNLAYFLLSLYNNQDKASAVLLVFFLTIINAKIISKEYLGLSNLTSSQTHFIYKKIKVIIISEY